MVLWDLMLEAENAAAAKIAAETVEAVDLPCLLYDAFQPFEVPTLDELVEGETRIDIN